MVTTDWKIHDEVNLAYVVKERARREVELEPVASLPQPAAFGSDHHEYN
jgi:hypothetical protein